MPDEIKGIYIDPMKFELPSRQVIDFKDDLAKLKMQRELVFRSPIEEIKSTLQTTALAQEAIGSVQSSISEIYNSIPQQVYSAVADMEEMVKNIQRTQIQSLAKDLASVADDIKHISAFHVADAVKNAASVSLDLKPLNIVVDYDAIKKEAHEKVVESAKEEEKFTGHPVPYNVLSMEFIFDYLIPTVDLIEYAANAGITDPGTGVIIALLIMINYGVFKIYQKVKPGKPGEIRFVDDED